MTVQAPAHETQDGATPPALPPPARAPEGHLPARVVHLVGRLTHEVMSFLAPTTAALAQHGVAQCLVVADGGSQRAELLGLAPQVRLVLVPPARRAWQHWRQALALLQAELQEHPAAALHVHGFVPALVGTWASRAGAGRLIHYSPHGSASLGRLRPLGTLAHWLFWPLRGGLPVATAIASYAAEARLLPRQTRAPVHVAESPVAAHHFDLVRAEAELPLIVASAAEYEARAGEQVARLAVLLGDEVVRARLAWLGPTSPQGDELLRAAGVPRCDDQDAQASADLLQAAWVCLAPAATTHFPLRLAQAMSAGLPCVALDTPVHRALVRHRETGYLCAGLDEMIEHTTALLDSRALRERIGAAARAEARRRFDEGTFRHALLAAYGATGPQQQGPVTPAGATPVHA